MAKTITTYPRRKKSVLQDINIQDFDLHWDTNPKSFAKNANKYEPAEPYGETQVYYDQGVFTDINELNRNRASLEDYRKNANFDRTLTKHRIVASPVKLYMSSYGRKFEKPSRITVTTTCAPNAMRRSMQDKQEFYQDNDLKHYQQFMKLQYQRILWAQVEQKTEVLIMPPFGLGVYLQTLSDTQKAKAIQLNYRALKEALNEQDDWGNLKEIICAMPDAGGKNNYHQVAKGELQYYSGSCPVTLAKVDMLECAAKCAEYYDVNLLNAGADNSIGGSYADTHQDRMPPAEETLTQASDLFYQQSNQKSAKFEAFPSHLNYTRQAVATSAAAPIHSTIPVDTKVLSKLFTNWTQVANDPAWIREPKGRHVNYQLSFNTSQAAQKLCSQLQANCNITAKPFKDKNYHVVEITTADFLKLRKTIVATIVKNELDLLSNVMVNELGNGNLELSFRQQEHTQRFLAKYEKNKNSSRVGKLSKGGRDYYTVAITPEKFAEIEQRGAAGGLTNNHHRMFNSNNPRQPLLNTTNQDDDKMAYCCNIL